METLPQLIVIILAVIGFTLNAQKHEPNKRNI